MIRKTSIAATLFLSAALIAACSQSAKEGTTTANPPASPKANNDPVTLTAYFDNVFDPELEPIIVAAVKAKYPAITLEIVKAKNTDELLAAGSPPDIVFTYPGNLPTLKDKGLLFDMSPLMKAGNVDAGRFEANLIEDVKAVSFTNQVVAVPYTKAFFALYYNKDLFDKFGVAYPKAGMAWEDTIDTAKKVTRMDGSTQYSGLAISNLHWTAFAYSARPVDYKTEKSAIASDVWKKVLELGYAINNIPGNTNTGGKNGFMKNKTLAMLLEVNIIPELEVAAKEGLNWDVTQFPSFKDKPGVSGSSFNVVSVTNTSKHKERAMQVIDVITSEEVQGAYAKLGKASPLKSEAVRKAFETGTESLKSKKLSDIFLGTQAPYPITTRFNDKAAAILNKHAAEYYKGTVDLNTTISRADEEINKMIEEEKTKTK
ncbi:MAG: extracellular solute-binding protein family 1 [Paenibacillus sp.]|nr:extracellular solute-binding protein family 1 [Paenibacillus sp.]